VLEPTTSLLRVKRASHCRRNLSSEVKGRGEAKLLVHLTGNRWIPSKAVVVSFSPYYSVLVGSRNWFETDSHKTNRSLKSI